MSEPIGPDDIMSYQQQQFLKKVAEIIEFVNAQLRPSLEQGRNGPIRVNLSMDLRDAVINNPALAVEFVARFKLKGWDIQRVSVYQFDFTKPTKTTDNNI